MTITRNMDLAIRLANVASDFPDDHRHRKTCMEAGDILADIEADEKPSHTPTTIPQEHDEPTIVAAVLMAVAARTSKNTTALRDRTQRGGRDGLSQARSIAYYILNREYNISTPNLAKHFPGGRSHSSIVESILRFEKAMESEEPYLKGKPAREWLAIVRSAIVF